MLGNLLEDLTISGFTNLTKSEEEPPRAPKESQGPWNGSVYSK